MWSESVPALMNDFRIDFKRKEAFVPFNKAGLQTGRLAWEESKLGNLGRNFGSTLFQSWFGKVKMQNDWTI